MVIENWTLKWLNKVFAQPITAAVIWRTHQFKCFVCPLLAHQTDWGNRHFSVKINYLFEANERTNDRLNSSVKMLGAICYENAYLIRSDSEPIGDPWVDELSFRMHLCKEFQVGRTANEYHLHRTMPALIGFRVENKEEYCATLSACAASHHQFWLNLNGIFI